MSAQGKPGYFVDAKTGAPPDHIEGVIGCVCSACLPISDADRAAMVNDLVEAFDISPGEAAAHVAVVEAEANARANGTASMPLRFAPGYTQSIADLDGNIVASHTFSTADVEEANRQIDASQLGDAAVKVQAIRERYETFRARAVDEHGHIPVAIVEAKLAGLTPDQREKLTTVIGMNPPRIILSPEEQAAIRDSVVVERDANGGLRAMVQPRDASAMARVLDAEERFGKGSEIALMVRALSAPPRPPAPPPAPREPAPPVVWQSARHKRLAQELAWAASGSPGDDCVEDEDYHRQAAELLAELDVLAAAECKAP